VTAIGRKKVGVLISGRGSNLQALLDACADPAYPARIVLVISNKPDVQGLERAERAGVPTRVIPHRDYATREAFDAAMTRALEEAEAEIVCMAGFMRVVSAEFIAHWKDRLLNIHPSLLPAFPGLDTHARALAEGAGQHGCTVHFARAEVDAGPIIGQTVVPVLPGDTEESLAARVLEAEHELYPRCLRLVAEGRARVTGGTVKIIDTSARSPVALLVSAAVLATIALIVTGFLIALSLGWDPGVSVQDIEETIRSWGPWGVALAIGLMVLHSFVPFPAEFLTIANGMIYGPVWGTAITWTGAMLGAYAAFGLSRWLGRPFAELMIARRDWHVIDEWSAREGGYVLLIARFIPLIAFNLINYVAGLTRISWWTFTWATGIGILPLTILLVVMGDNIDSLAWQWWLLLGAAAILLWLVLKRRLAGGRQIS
jgi:phosphoribosylglycinamide formyltransferase-1